MDVFKIHHVLGRYLLRYSTSSPSPNRLEFTQELSSLTFCCCFKQQVTRHSGPRTNYFAEQRCHPHNQDQARKVGTKALCRSSLQDLLSPFRIKWQREWDGKSGSDEDKLKKLRYRKSQSRCRAELGTPSASCWGRGHCSPYCLDSCTPSYIH